MKTFLLDTLNRYSRFSDNLDVKTILCNKSWWIFNNSGAKELYIFQEDGTLIASVSGNVTNATWQYIPANKSLVIAFKEQSYMLHPSFIDEIVFVLQQDGTEQYFFMIREEQCNSFQPKSLNELQLYFDRKEQAEKEKQLQQEQAVITDMKRIMGTHVQNQYRNEQIVEQKGEWKQRRSTILKNSTEYQRLLNKCIKWKGIKIPTLIVAIVSTLGWLESSDYREDSLPFIIFIWIFFVIAFIKNSVYYKNLSDYEGFLKKQFINQ